MVRVMRRGRWLHLDGADLQLFCNTFCSYRCQAGHSFFHGLPNQLSIIQDRNTLAERGSQGNINLEKLDMKNFPFHFRLTDQVRLGKETQPHAFLPCEVRIYWALPY